MKNSTKTDKNFNMIESISELDWTKLYSTANALENIDIEQIQDYDHCNKHAYLTGKISKKDFLLIEVLSKFVINTKKHLSANAQKELKEILFNM